MGRIHLYSLVEFSDKFFKNMPNLIQYVPFSFGETDLGIKVETYTGIFTHELAFLVLHSDFSANLPTTD